ncbi:MAG: hypothetical protein HRU06_22235 [Oceanospirillaceae bacterium]|nr:hypothetical protein [Oceanospirillaceae bacterium]
MNVYQLSLRFRVGVTFNHRSDQVKENILQEIQEGLENLEAGRLIEDTEVMGG